MNIYIDVFLATVGLWLFFIITAKVANGAKSRAELNWFQYSVAVLFLIADVIYNFTYGAVLFMEPASMKRKTFTARLKYYLLTEPDSWRGKLAAFMCKYMIEPWDFGHCALD